VNDRSWYEMWKTSLTPLLVVFFPTLICSMRSESVGLESDSSVANLLPILPTFVRDARYQGDAR
jgi:hypothetical protein